MSEIRFEFSDDGETFVDHETHLTWQSDVPEKRMTLKQAKTYASELKLDGGGWRVPTLVELQTLVDTKRELPATFPELVDITPSDWFWSSTAYSGSSSSAWNVNFSSGYSNGNGITDAYRARCVR